MAFEELPDAAAPTELSNVLRRVLLLWRVRVVQLPRAKVERALLLRRVLLFNAPKEDLGKSNGGRVLLI